MSQIMRETTTWMICEPTPTSRSRARRNRPSPAGLARAPGDTIFIYYSDHGGQINDDNNEDAGDEPDGKDEYLVTHDCVTLAVLQNLLKEQNETRARDPALAQWVDYLVGPSRVSVGRGP